jgi:hypothetical protein
MVALLQVVEEVAVALLLPDRVHLRLAAVTADPAHLGLTEWHMQAAAVVDLTPQIPAWAAQVVQEAAELVELP